MPLAVPSAAGVSRPRAAVLALLGLLLLATAGSPDLAAAAERKGCKPAQVTVTVEVRKGRKARTKRLCVGAPKSETGVDRAIRRGTLSPLKARKSLPRRWRKLFPRKALKRHERAHGRVLASSAASPWARTASAGGGCEDSRARTLESPPVERDGVAATGHGGGWGRPGTGSFGTFTDVTTDDGKGMTERRRSKRCVAWDACPTAEGIVRGDYEVSELRVVRRVTADTDASLEIGFEVHADAEARVGDDARVRDFDWKARGTIEVAAQGQRTGENAMRAPTRVLRMAAEQQRVDPRNPSAAAPPKSAARGPQGSAFSPGDVEQVKRIATVVAAIPDNFSLMLLAAEKGWYDEMLCVDAVLDPAESLVEPGQAISVGVSARTRDGDPMPRATFSATADRGTVSPASGAAPASVGWTAPERMNEYGLPEPSFNVVVTSRRGRGRAQHMARPSKGEPRFHVTVASAVDYSWTHSGSSTVNPGSQTECRTTTNGSGTWRLSLASPDRAPGDPKAGHGGIYHGGSFVQLSGGYLDGTVSQAGGMSESRTGPGCYGSGGAWEDSGCESRPAEYTVGLAWANGRALVTWEPVGEVFFDDCPLREPEHEQALFAMPPEDAYVSLPRERLEDPSEDVVTASGSRTDRGFESCDLNGGQGCAGGTTYETSATRTASWSVTLRRLSP